MEYVFIDTSVYKAEGYIKGSTIKSLFALARKKEICILLPELTKYEVFQHLKEDVLNDGSSKSIHKLQNGFYMAIPQAKQAIDYLETIKSQLVDMIKQSLEKELKGAIELKNPVNFNMQKLLDKYMNDKYPFSKGNKKHEFPDAIVLQQLEDWCNQQNTTCLIFSNDRDMQNYSGSSLTYKDYKEYNEAKTNELSANYIQQFLKSVQAKIISIKKQLKEWTLYTLDNEILYCVFLQIPEINQVDFRCIEVELDNDYKLVGAFDDIQVFSTTANIKAKICVTHPNYETAYYDREDNKWYFIDDEVETSLEWNYAIPVEINFDITDSYIEVSSINNNETLPDQNIQEGLSSEDNIYER